MSVHPSTAALDALRQQIAALEADSGPPKAVLACMEEGAAPWRRQAEAADFGQPTAAMTRWRISLLPSSALPVPGVGRARWLIELIRARAGESLD